MPSFVWSQLRSRRWRALALGVAILVASASFELLTAAGRTTEARVRGSVQSNYRTAYDILVRPPGSQAPLERSQGLVRNNYLSGLFGGITLAQYEKIQRIPAVEVAAPVANIGYVIPGATPTIPLNDLLNHDPVQLYRIRYESIAHGGTSRYSGWTEYVYVTGRDRFDDRGSEILPGGRKVSLEPCWVYTIPSSGPFAWAKKGVPLSCYSLRSPGLGADTDAEGAGGHPGQVVSGEPVSFPILLAAIDPAEEARLLGLDRTMVEGRYLLEGEGPEIDDHQHRLVPVIASTTTYVDEDIVGHIERLSIPAGADVTRILSTTGTAGTFLTDLPGREVARRSISAQEGYEDALAGTFGNAGPVNISWSYWTASPVAYNVSSDGRLTPIPVKNPRSIWRGPFGYQQIPTANADVQFRRLYPRIGSVYFHNGILDTPLIHIVGRYDPTHLPGFSPLSQVPLETYYPPELLPGDAATRRALHDKPLLPSQNLGDYVAQPPLFLTTLEGMEPFLNSKYYAGASGAAPISVIRVRVKGVTGPDAVSQARVRAVATEIHDRTGLQVDITAGSSPQELLVNLPAGRYGRPALVLREGWSKKGVAVSFVQALDRKRLGLLSLILVACMLFLANGAFAAVRGRRREIGTLVCLGWPKKAIFAAVLGELVAVGLLAGSAASGIAALGANLMRLDLPLVRAVIVVPLAVTLAVVAGLLPAWRAASSLPMEAVQPMVSIGAARRRVRHLGSLALANVRRTPSRSIVAAGGLFVASAALTLLLAVNEAFHGSLVGTLLGNAISVQVRGLDFLAIGVIVLLSTLSLADVLYLNLKERAAEVVTLLTLGWSEGQLRRVIATEAAILGLLGSVLGAAVGLITGFQLGVGPRPLLLASLVSVLGGVGVGLLASLVALARLSALTVPSALAEE